MQLFEVYENAFMGANNVTNLNVRQQTVKNMLFRTR